MVKYTQIIRLQQPTACLCVLDHFVGLALKGLRDRPQVSLLTLFEFKELINFYCFEIIRKPVVC